MSARYTRRATRGSSFWRWTAAAALVVTALPLLRSQPSARNPLPSVAAAADNDYPGEVVVSLKSPASAGTLSDLSRRFSAAFAPDDAPGEPAQIFTVTAAPAGAPALLAALRADPRIAAAEMQRTYRLPANETAWKPQPVEAERPSDDGWRPNDPRFGEQWNFQRIHMDQAWPVTHGKGAVVAVIDTGVAFQNSPRGAVARDFRQTSFVAPYDFVHRDKNPYDDNGHGTHVAGTIAESTNNDEGVAGIAFEAGIMPIKVLTAVGSGRMSDVAAGIRYAADHGANVINMSLGAPFPDNVTRSACKYARDKGVTIVCAAGNSGSEGVSYPAAYPECIAVSALGPTGELAPYSSWGDAVSISAPGGDKTRGPQAGILQNTVYDGVDDYFAFQGTSMATPHVAAVAALVVSQGIKDPAEVKAVLEKTAQQRGPHAKYGAGELDAAAAAKRAGAEAGDYWARLRLAAVLWAGCLVIGLLRRRVGTHAPVGATLAITIGLFFPDVIAAFAGYESSWNLLGHSAMVPAFLLISEARVPRERQFYGLFAAGLTWHLLGDLWQGTAPLLGGFTWAAIPWLWTNMAVGAGTFIAGIRRFATR